MFSKIILLNYLKSMRPYLFFISGMAGCMGVAFCGEKISIWRAVIVLFVVFVGWGVNQVINDLLGLNEDRINAPHRPLVTGSLPISSAVILSVLFFILGAGITLVLNAQALVLYFLAFALNIVYEYSKRVPFLGNIIFGLLLTPCLYYGAMCLNGKGIEIIADSKLAVLALGIVLINITVAFYTYFKDYLGDRETGTKTIVVKFSPQKAKHLNFIMSAFPFGIVVIMFFSEFWRDYLNPFFLALMVLTFLIMQYTAFLFFKHEQGKNTYYSLKWNFRGAVLYKTAFIAMVNPLLGGILYLINFILVGWLFDFHKDPLA